MKALICVDDTDSITKMISTGKIAEYIKSAIMEHSWGVCSDITRHQLLLHEDIPYTSHNSSMCMELEMDEDKSDEIIALGTNVLETYMDESSSPGFCYCLYEALSDNAREELIDFGRQAQRVILKKEDASLLAKRCGFHLSEHGGTGQGIIGAAAGVGLRLSGNDGRFRGKIKVISQRKDSLISVGDILAQSGAAEVQDMDGAVLDMDQLITLNQYAKAIYANFKKVIVVSRQENGSYITCTKEELESREDG
jgi:hypothetical protein